MNPNQEVLSREQAMQLKYLYSRLKKYVLRLLKPWLLNRDLDRRTKLKTNVQLLRMSIRSAWSSSSRCYWCRNGCTCCYILFVAEKTQKY